MMTVLTCLVVRSSCVVCIQIWSHDVSLMHITGFLMVIKLLSFDCDKLPSYCQIGLYSLMCIPSDAICSVKIVK